ncbi:MAG: DUF2306 domain-containing protein [Nannocystaceae bacterium]|nr:DUF2306 domain-containing protein [Nannocystaceae bacterium]
MNLSRREWIFLVGIVSFSAIPVIGGLLRAVELAGGPAIVPEENPRALASPLPIVVHIVSSFLFCIVGALQFVPSLRRRRLAMHRKMGRPIAIAGGISALTGLWMTHFYAFPADLQGRALYWTRIVLGLAMLGLIGWAWVAIRKRGIPQRVPRHGAAMIRAYAIAQGASTQAFLGIGWTLLSGASPRGPFRDGLMVFAWVVNFAVAEYAIGKTLGRRRASASPG